MAVLAAACSPTVSPHSPKPAPIPSAVPVEPTTPDLKALDHRIRNADLSSGCRDLAEEIAGLEAGGALLIPALSKALLDHSDSIEPEAKWQAYRLEHNYQNNQDAELCVLPLVSAFGQLGDNALGPLCDVVRNHPLPVVRATAIEALTGIASPPDPRYASSDPRTVTSSTASRSCLVDAMKDPSDLVQLTALRGLETEDPTLLQSPELLQYLVHVQVSGHPARSPQAAALLLRAGTNGSDALLAAVADPKRLVHEREQAGLALRRHGSYVIPPLTALLDGPDGPARIIAAITLAHLGEGGRMASRIVDQLEACSFGWQCHDATGRWESEESARRNGEYVDWQELKSARKKRDISCKEAEAKGVCYSSELWLQHALEVTGPAASAEVPRLIALTGSDRAGIAEAAVRALDAIGSAGCSAWLGMPQSDRFKYDAPRWTYACK